jgi:hypothetical protein
MNTVDKTIATLLAVVVALVILVVNLELRETARLEKICESNGYMYQQIGPNSSGIACVGADGRYLSPFLFDKK